MEIKVEDFNLEATLESGQVFGFTKDSRGRYEGVIFGTLVQLYQDREFLSIEGNGSAVSEHSIRTYFDLDHNLTILYRLLCEDNHLRSIYHRLRGLRIIRQEPWEALACFIISSNNHIKRIQRIRRNLSQAFCRSEFRFPEACDLVSSDERTLRELGLGYRAPFLLSAAGYVSASPVNFNHIRETSYEQAKSELMNFPGVGEKVADCVLLFGFQKYEAFPVDIWILRAMRKLYFRGRKVSGEKVRAYGQKRWGLYAGYVQQYLYYAAKSGMIKL